MCVCVCVWWLRDANALSPTGCDLIHYVHYPSVLDVCDRTEQPRFLSDYYTRAANPSTTNLLSPLCIVVPLLLISTCIFVATFCHSPSLSLSLFHVFSFAQKCTSNPGWVRRVWCTHKQPDYWIRLTRLFLSCVCYHFDFSRFLKPILFSDCYLSSTERIEEWTD